MKKLRKGSALSTVILAIFVMTAIGSCVINLIVYNYRLRQLDLKIKRAEYKNEIIMDKIYEITQNTIITAIGLAKTQAIEAVDKAVSAELELYNKYTQEKSRLTNEWVNGLGDVTFANTDAYNAALNSYIEDNIAEEYKSISFYFTNDGIQNQYVIHQEYDNVFKELYKYALDNNQTPSINNKVPADLTEIHKVEELVGNICTGDKYDDIITNVSQNLYFTEDNFERFETDIKGELTQDKVYINSDISFDENKNVLILSNETIYKILGVPSVNLEADFVLRIPNFDSISGVDQRAIEFSNPLIGNKALIAGGKININSAGNSNIIAEVKGDAIALEGISVDTAKFEVDGKLITGGDIELANSDFSTNTLFYQSLYLRGDSQNTVSFNGDVYARDDLEIENGKFKIIQTKGNYYGFNDRNDKGPDASSSIIINAPNIESSSFITLNNLYLAGRAFIDNVENYHKDGEFYKTGESIAVKGNYIAYLSSIEGDSDYSFGKVNYASYLFNEEEFRLVNTFADNLLDEQIAEFDVNHKWRYFVDFAEYIRNKGTESILKIPNITINSIKYMQGAGLGKVGNSGENWVLDANVTGLLDDKAFKTNCANEYELQTKYFGYHSDKTEIFGENGWLNPIPTQTKYYINTQPILVVHGDLDINNQELGNYKIIICDGDITINKTSETTAQFYGVIIAGGDINVNGRVIFNSNKNGVVEEIINGADDDTETAARKLFSLFKYDGSGTRYIITAGGASNININELIGIINWNKKDWGFL